MTSMQDQTRSGHKALPWWRFTHVWLVIAGPALVVVAGLYTVYLAMSQGDELVTEYPAQTAIAKDQEGRAFQTSGQAPAMKARNHAQTPVVPVR